MKTIFMILVSLFLFSCSDKKIEFTPNKSRTTGKEYNPKDFAYATMCELHIRKDLYIPNKECRVGAAELYTQGFYDRAVAIYYHECRNYQEGGNIETCSQAAKLLHMLGETKEAIKLLKIVSRQTGIQSSIPDFSGHPRIEAGIAKLRNGDDSFIKGIEIRNPYGKFKSYAEYQANVNANAKRRTATK